MPNSRKKNMVIASGIWWLGIVIATLVLTYLPHGPAKHPTGMILIIAVIPVLGVATSSMLTMKVSKTIVLAQLSLFFVGFIGWVALSVIEPGSRPHPITASIFFAVLGMVAVGIMMMAEFKELEEESLLEQASDSSEG